MKESKIREILISYQKKRDKAETKNHLYNDYASPPPFVNTTQQIGRNDPCDCGSGKKYKKTCNCIV